LGAAGVKSMMVVLLVAGIGFLLVGLLGIGFGLPVKEFSFGNTLILAGAVATCSGMILLGLWTVVRELKSIARRLDAGATAAIQPFAIGAASRDQVPENEDSQFHRDPSSQQDAGRAESAAPPWHEEAAARDRSRLDEPSAPEPAEAAPETKPRRNLLFSSSSRRERDRAQARAAEPPVADPAPAVTAPPPAKPSEMPPPATFDDAWPQPERSRTADSSAQRRSTRTPSTFTAAGAGATGADRSPPAARSQDQPPVTVLKSGVVDGMAYSLYSDGSIEAQMPEGMMRFASIDELRSHLDQRP
jgi:hypothetical protein